MNTFLQSLRFLVFIFAVVWCGLPAFSQNTIHGVIRDSASGNPVASASVFISRTQSGAVSQANGSFTLQALAISSDLVVSCIGFETQVLHLPAMRKDSDVMILLIPKSAILDNVTVTAKAVDRTEWLKYHAIFLKAFLGESDFAANCVIENANVLHYQYNAETNALTAYADKPVVIVNKSLGYSIQYSLEDFLYNINMQELYYAGYPLFTPLTGNVRQMAKWRENRKEAYNGSLLQFMRSVYRDQVIQDGFEVKKIVKMTAKAPEKNSSSKKRHKREASFQLTTTSIADTNYFNMVSDEPLPADSFAYAADSVTAAITCADKYVVRYTKKMANSRYTSADVGILGRQPMVSYLSLRNSNEPVFVESNGSFFPLHQLIVEGYWGWSERVGRSLPYDYIPGH